MPKGYGRKESFNCCCLSLHLLQWSKGAWKTFKEPYVLTLGKCLFEAAQERSVYQTLRWNKEHFHCQRKYSGSNSGISFHIFYIKPYSPAFRDIWIVFTLFISDHTIVLHSTGTWWTVTEGCINKIEVIYLFKLPGYRTLSTTWLVLITKRVTPLVFISKQKSPA